MDQEPLVNEEIEAGAELVREFDKFAPVEAAFWVKARDESQRYLYIASDRISDENIDVAYSEILRLSNDLRSPYLDPFRVKLIDADNPLSMAAVEILTRYSARIPTRFGGKSFGGMSVEEVYLYPRPLPVVVPTSV